MKGYIEKRMAPRKLSLEELSIEHRLDLDPPGCHCKLYESSEEGA